MFLLFLDLVEEIHLFLLFSDVPQSELELVVDFERLLNGVIFFFNLRFTGLMRMA